MSTEYTKAKIKMKTCMSPQQSWQILHLTS